MIRRSCLLAVVLLVPAPAGAHVGAVGEGGSTPVPSWYLLLAGGAVVALSFLFTSLVADHEGIRQVNAFELTLSVPRPVRRAAVWTGRAAGLAVLAILVVVAVAGPQRLTGNLAALCVLVGWWGGYTMSTFLVGNTWPLVSPWHALSSVDVGRATLPERWGSWPAVAGLLALAFLAVVVPFDSQPRLLAVALVGYSLVAVVGVVAVGPRDWFRRVDPLAATFRAFGSVAPVGRSPDGLAVGLPGAALVRRGGPTESGYVGFAMALLWVSTYDGLVSTPAWRAVLAPAVGAGVPAPVGYLVALLGGYAGFLGAYRLAARKARDTAGTYVTADAIERRMAPSLLLIAAGYHVAHFAGSVLALWPAMLAVVGTPLSPPASVPVVVLPSWFVQLEIGAILLGHMAGIWVAHSIAFELFPGDLQPIRSQYPFVAVMILYTVVSLWALILPSTPTPFV